MKKMLYMLLFIIMIASAFATFEVADVKLGGASQERGETTSVQVTVKNVGSKAIDGITASFSGVAAKYNPSVTFSSQTIPVNGTVTMTVQGSVPLDLDAVDSNGKKVAVSIGSIVLKGNYSDDTPVSQKTAALTMEAENNLVITSDSRILYGEEDTKLRNDKSYDDVKRGDVVTLEVEVENKFSNSGDCQDDGTDCDIEDIEINVEAHNSDFDDDSADTSDIGSDDTDSATLTFEVPDDQDKGNYKFDLYVTGTDENGARHGEFWTFDFDVVVEKDEITIKSATLSPSRLECTEKHTTLSVKIENTGTRDQSKASIFVESAKLGLNEQVYNLDLKDGDTETKTFELSLPSKLASGSYPIIVRANYDADEETDVASVTLIVDECFDDSSDDVVDDNSENNGNVPDDSNTDVNIIEVPPNTGVIVGEEKQSFFESPQYVMMLAGLFLIALLIFFVLVVLLLRK